MMENGVISAEMTECMNHHGIPCWLIRIRRGLCNQCNSMNFNVSSAVHWMLVDDLIAANDGFTRFRAFIIVVVVVVLRLEYRINQVIAFINPIF